MSDGGGDPAGGGRAPGAAGGGGAPSARPRVLVTRAADQASELAAALRAAGWEPLSCPVIRIETAPAAALAPCLPGLSRYDWVVFTSENGVRHFLALLGQAGRGARDLGGARVAAVGPGTAAALADAGLRADLVPAEARGEGLRRELLAAGPVAGLRVLRVRGDLAAPDVEEALRGAGAKVDVVTAYRTLPIEPPPPALAAVRGGGVAAVTFYSPSAVTGLERSLPGHGLHAGTPAVCVGPVTAAAAAAAGWARVVTAAEATAAGVVAALREALRAERP